jgi:hypothetical protein
MVGVGDVRGTGDPTLLQESDAVNKSLNPEDIVGAKLLDLDESAHIIKSGGLTLRPATLYGPVTACFV